MTSIVGRGKQEAQQHCDICDNICSKFGKMEKIWGSIRIRRFEIINIKNNDAHSKVMVKLKMMQKYRNNSKYLKFVSFFQFKKAKMKSKIVE